MIRQAVIFTGGLGTRLGDMTANLPKPLVHVGGRPFLEYLLDMAGAQGFSEIMLLTGFRGDMIADLYDGSVWHGAIVRCIREAEPLGTAGALRNAEPFLQSAFILMNGDSFFDINLRFLASEAMKTKGAGMITLRAAEGSRYGSVELDGSQLHSFAERGEGRYMNCGVYALHKTLLGYIEKTVSSLEGDIFPGLAAKGLLHGRVFDRFFIDIGVPAALAEAQSSVPATTMRPAVFFDRDGVLNIDTGYVHKPEDFEWRQGVVDAIRLLNDSGWSVFVVTNQSGVARGLYNEDSVRSLHRWMNDELDRHGAHINAFYYCPHHPDGVIDAYRRSCSCRKPEAGLLLQAMREWPVARERSVMIGDKASDVAAGEKAGVRGMFIAPGDDLLEIVRQAMAER